MNIKFIDKETIYAISSILGSLALVVISKVFGLLVNNTILFISIILLKSFFISRANSKLISFICSSIFTIYLLIEFDIQYSIIIILLYAFTYYTRTADELNSKYLDEMQDAIWDLTEDVLFIKDLNLRYIQINKAMERFFKLNRNDIIGKTDSEIFDKKIAKVYNETDLEVFNTRTKVSIFEETEVSGVVNQMMTIKQPLTDHENNIYGVFGISRNITEIYEIKKQLEENNELLENILHYVPNPIFIKDLNSFYVRANKAFCDIHELSEKEIIGKSDYDLFPKVIADKFNTFDKEVSDTGKVMINRTTTKIKGKVIHAIDTKAPVYDKNGEVTHIIGIVQDLSLYKNLESKILENQKMSSIKNLASTIAHDLNNILSSSLGYASLMRSIEENEEKISYIDNILNASKQASDLINRLMIFTKQYPDKLVSLNLNDIVTNIYNLIKPSINNKITVITDLQEIPNIDGDLSKINQVIMNLLVNAVEAIYSDGRIYINSSVIEIHDFSRFKYIPNDLKPGKFVVISIRDTVIGIPESIINRIFEPFFTTKNEENRKGTGLGLSIVYGIVLNHYGLISLESVEGEGTLFEVFFPVGSLTTSNNHDRYSLIYGKGNILCIDDEQIIHDLLMTTLTKLGYTKLTAYSGEDGVEIYSVNFKEIDCVILDFSMPGINGIETFKKLKEINPDVKVILSTGYGAKVDIDKLLKEGIANFLPKPYTVKDLSYKLDLLISS